MTFGTEEANLCSGQPLYKKYFEKIVIYGIMFKVNEHKEVVNMKHIKTLNTQSLKNTMKKGGCGECQTSCQSACKTSCTVGNQSCENSNNR